MSRCGQTPLQASSQAGFCLTGVITKTSNLNDLFYIAAKDTEGPCNVHFHQKWYVKIHN